jgi:hypothetical protein
MTPNGDSATGSGALRILLLADDQRGHANTIHDHIQAFRHHSRHHVELFNPRGLAKSRFLDLDAFDVVVVHYSLVVTSDLYLGPWFREQIAAFDGLKIQFLQDEYRWVDDITAMMRYLGIDVLFSVIPPAGVEPVYGARLPDVEVVSILTGYVSEELRRAGAHVKPTAARPIDVGYRGRSVPFWLGRLGHEKLEIGRRFLGDPATAGLRCDIAWTERSRIYGERWIEFISSCRATLASESGSSVVDFDGSAERSTHAYLMEHPLAEYEEVERDVLAPWHAGPAINAISPRIFEAAALRTALVMFPGSYSGVVEPEEHYIVLEKDFSNIGDVAAKLKDTPLLEAVVERAHDALIASDRYSSRAFIAQFDEVVDRRARRRARGSMPPRLALRTEELSAGRTYWTSSFYGTARRGVLAAVGMRYLMRTRPLRRLARVALTTRDDPRIWDDLFRLGIVTSAHSGTLRTGDGTFDVVPAFEDGLLVLTSTADSRPSPDLGIESRVADAIGAGSLRDIVWNHTAVGQYVRFELRPTKRQLHIDVGSYDTYGVYRFNALTQLARARPALVLDALAPLLGKTAPNGSPREGTGAPR